MMFAELMDHIDLYETLLEQGAPIKESDSIDAMCKKSSQWLKQQNMDKQQAVKALMAEWLSDKNVLLPEIRQALNAYF